ncbi:MAG: lactonase family protein [Verrucomicrobia bacterium]|nr:lactonase family protein [Verrucomicrobiota bacterium]
MHRWIRAGLVAWIVAATAWTAGAAQTVYIGTYSQRGSEGIYMSRLDPATGQLAAPTVAAKATNPSFLALHPKLPVLYAVNETGRYEGKPVGAVIAFAVDETTGALTELNREPTGGPVPCHLAVDATGSHLVIANYVDGTVASFPLAPDGRLKPVAQLLRHEGSGPNARRQKGPHAHGVTFAPANDFVFVPDLGIDRVVGYRFDAKTGRLDRHEPACGILHPGAGPRHFAFRPDGKTAYAVNELDATVTAFRWAGNELKSFATVPGAPKGFEGTNTAAEVVAHPSGRFLYTSNRGHNSIAVFTLDADGKPAPVQHQSTGGRAPRNFTLDPAGRFLVAANQDSDNILAFRVDPDTGRLTPTGSEIAVAAPVCVLFR